MIVYIGVQNLRASDVGSGKYRLTKQWETENNLRIPESVLYDKTKNILYVSNINGKPTEKNGKGFISKVLLNGKIEKLKSLYCRRHQK